MKERNMSMRKNKKKRRKYPVIPSDGLGLRDVAGRALMENLPDGLLGGDGEALKRRLTGGEKNSR